MPVKYECDICFKVFSHKSHYNSHLKRMTPCIPNSSISPNILENIHPNSFKMDETCLKNVNQCCGCFIIFSNKFNRTKHEKTSKCSLIILQKEKESDQNSILLEKMKMLEDKLADLEAKQPSTINNNNTNNNSHNTTNYIQNIVINKHGDEDMSYLTDNQKMLNLSKGFNSVVDYLKKKHFDPKHPENSNIFRDSLKSSEVYIYNGEKWIIDNLHDAVYNLNDNITSEIKDNYKELKHKLPPKVKELYEHTLNNNNELVAKTQNKMIKQMLYNERDIPLKIKKANKTNKRLK